LKNSASDQNRSEQLTSDVSNGILHYKLFSRVTLKGMPFMLNIRLACTMMLFYNYLIVTIEQYSMVWLVLEKVFNSVTDILTFNKVN